MRPQVIQITCGSDVANALALRDWPPKSWRRQRLQREARDPTPPCPSRSRRPPQSLPQEEGGAVEEGSRWEGKLGNGTQGRLRLHRAAGLSSIRAASMRGGLSICLSARSGNASAWSRARRGWAIRAWRGARGQRSSMSHSHVPIESSKSQPNFPANFEISLGVRSAHKWLNLTLHESTLSAKRCLVASDWTRPGQFSVLL